MTREADHLLRKLPFSNNLKKDDRVFDTVSERHGKVPRNLQSDQQRATPVILDGTNTVRYLDVMQLRLIINGRTPEEVPPVDGEPPPREERAPASNSYAVLTQPPAQASPLEILRAQRTKLLEECQSLNDRFKVIKAELEKLERAIAVLAEP